MKISRRNFCLLMAGACCTGVLAACGSSSSSTASSSAASASATASGEVRDELIFVNYRDIRDLNPHLYAGEMYAQSILYDTLVSITANGYEGCLAESWDISEDGCTYTFHIRPNVLFSDGEKCDANAILANFNAILENRERHTWLEMMNLLVGVSAPDENTFVIEMSEPYYPMLTELGCIRPFAMISPNCMINGSTKDGVNGHIGTGPYVLTDFVTDEYAVFERNENYWGETPAIRKITVKVIPDNQTRIMALESGEIDLIFGKNMIDADAISQYLDSDKFTVGLKLIDLGNEVSYIDVDTSKVPYTFSVKLGDRTFAFSIRYNEVGGFFTVDLSIASTGEVLVYGDIVRYGRPLFNSVEDERFPVPVIMPLCLTGDDISEVTFENFGKEVRLYLWERNAA